MSNKQFVFLMAVFCIAGMICRKLNPKDKYDEVTIGGKSISRTPCLSVVNGMFGPAVDSNKACDCLLPGYYELVKDDPEELTKFDYIGIHMLPGGRNELVNQLFTRCIGDHIIDSTRKMHLTGMFATGLRQKVADHMRTDSTYMHYNPDTVAQCIIDNLNDHITVQDFIGLSALSDSAMKELISPCLVHRK